VSLDQRLPLAHERAQFIGGQIHAVESRQQVFAGNISALQFDFAMS